MAWGMMLLIGTPMAIEQKGYTRAMHRIPRSPKVGKKMKELLTQGVMVKPIRKRLKATLRKLQQSRSCLVFIGKSLLLAALRPNILTFRTSSEDASLALPAASPSWQGVPAA